ncbi:MAG: hypothetical protein ACM3SY_10560, partial [Candidatus Omnitrophota bacterium]
PETVPDTGPMKMPPESNEEEFFLYHFKRSAVVRHQMLADFYRFRRRDRELIEMELQESRKKETP